MLRTRYMILPLFLSLFVISACGFEPVYGTKEATPSHYSNQSSSVESALSLVAIGNIPDREGQMLRNALIDRFYRYNRPTNPLYKLDIMPIEEQIIDLDITETADTTRGQLRLSTKITLIESKTGKIVLQRNLRSLASYNILASEFANRVSEQSTRENAVQDLARQIEMQVNLYLKR